jgi:hypothetical protein
VAFLLVQVVFAVGLGGDDVAFSDCSLSSVFNEVAEFREGFPCLRKSEVLNAAK